MKQERKARLGRRTIFLLALGSIVLLGLGVGFSVLNPTMSRCALHPYVIEGKIKSPARGMRVETDLGVILRPNDKKGSFPVDETDGSFQIELKFDPTNSWRWPFGRDICNVRPKSIGITLEVDGRPPVRRRFPIRRSNIEIDEGEPGTFSRQYRVQLGEVGFPRTADSPLPLRQ